MLTYCVMNICFEQKNTLTTKKHGDMILAIFVGQIKYLAQSEYLLDKYWGIGNPKKVTKICSFIMIYHPQIMSAYHFICSKQTSKYTCSLRHSNHKLSLLTLSLSVGLNSPLILTQNVVRWIGIVLRFITIYNIYICMLV